MNEEGNSELNMHKYLFARPASATNREWAGDYRADDERGERGFVCIVCQLSQNIVFAPFNCWRSHRLLLFA